MSSIEEDAESRDRFGEVDDQYDPETVEERVFEYWDEVDAYERTKEHRADGETFFFVDGPPYTSGAAHMGTTWNKSLKDAYIRYHRMKGYDVTDRPGYDMHGLPIETKVEEKLGFENKKDIREYGEEAFIEACKEFADEQLEGLQDDFESFGVWMDWDDPYKTVSPEYMEAAWWGFKQVAERGLVDQGMRSISQCPRCETAIANNEVEYEDVSDPSIYVKFDLDDREGSLVIWTTTPWTVPSNEYVAVDEEMEYQKVRAWKDGESEEPRRRKSETSASPESHSDSEDSSDGSSGDEPRDSEVLYVAAECVEGVLKAGRYDDYEVLETLPGAEMLGWTYTPPLADEVPDAPSGDGLHAVYHGDWVEADRTGLVHSAPGHGEEDFRRGRELDLPVFCPVGGDGVYTDEAGKYAGQYVKDADEEIMADLEEKGNLLASGTYEHSYGHCWRCGTGILQIVTDQWFITITDVKEDLLDNIDDSEWHPGWARDSRFRDFVEDAPDWNVSRQRYWGIPIPIWVPEGWDGEAHSASGSRTQSGGGDMDEAVVVGTREELADLVEQDVDPETVDLHKPTVDDLTFERDGRTYRRVPDVFDVWLDSSVASWGTLDYPSETEAFDDLWPADLIMEAHDQTRGWFWSQLGMGTAALDEIPYEEVLMHGFANDENGRKMSKSVGNVVQPFEAIERHGSDAMRMFLLGVNPQGEDMRFSWDEMATMGRNLNILWNVFRFPLPYMRMDGFDPESVALSAQRNGSGEAAGETTVENVELETVDRWVLSRLQSVEDEMEERWGAFEQHKALDALMEFVVSDLSRFYVQVVRERMWEEEESESKRAAYATFYHVMTDVVALLAPYAPFITEEINRTLVADDEATVHMRDWPTPDRELRDLVLEDQIEVARNVEEAGSNARQQGGRKLRWPVARVVVDADDEDVADAVEAQADLLKERLNAREIQVIGADEAWDELGYTARADMSVLGPAFGGEAGAVMNALNEASVAEADIGVLAEAVQDALGEDVELSPEMVEFVEETPEGVAGAAFAGGVVYVDTTLDEDIESEGYAREVVRRVQEMRKDLELDLEERIRLELDVADERVSDLVSRHEDLIAEEVRADEFAPVADGHRRDWEVEGVEMTITIESLD